MFGFHFGRSIQQGAPSTSSSNNVSSFQQQQNRCTFVVEGYTYNYVVDGSFTFLAVSEER